MSQVALILFISLFSVSLHAGQPVVILNDQDSHYLIGRQVLLFEDETRSLTFQDILKPENQQEFVLNADDAPNKGYTNHVFWVKMIIRNTAKRPQIWYLEVGYPSLDYVDLYQKDQNGLWKTKRTGDRLPFSSREVSYRNFVFQPDLPAGRTDTLYLRIQSEGSLSFPLSIMNETSFRHDVHESQLSFGLYYGIFIALMLYNLLIFFSIRDTNYIYYVMYMSSFLVMQMNLNGLAFEYLWPGLPDLNNRSLPLLIGLVYLFSIGFANRLLNTRHFSPRLYKFMVVLEILGIGIILGSLFLPYQIIIRIAAGSALTLAPTIMTAAIIGLMKKYRPARFFFFAWFFFLFGMVLFSLKNMGVLPSNFLTVYSLQIGSALEIILLSLALADRINLLKSELEEKEREKQQLERERFIIARQVTIGILHEIRQPLQILRGILDVLQLPSAIKENERKTMIERAQSGVDKIKGYLIRLETLQKQYFQTTKNYTKDEKMIDLGDTDESKPGQPSGRDRKP